MIIACELLGMPWRWGWGNAAEGRTVEPAPTSAGDEPLALAIQEKIAHAKTSQAYANLISGAKDLILVASKPSSEDLALASSLGVTLDVQLVARDALVFLVYGTNPVTSLTVDQIRRIYMKQITNWSEVGGPYGAIHPYTRPDQSGSQQLMMELVMKDASMGSFPAEMKPTFMGAMVDQLRTDELGFGYSVYYFVMYQYVGSGARLVKVNGVWPTYETLANQQYPLTSETLVVTRADLDPNCAAGQMRSWLLSPEGQQIVKKSGYVPVNL
jgi:phosphate transport system substrate-binding protein